MLEHRLDRDPQQMTGKFEFHIQGNLAGVGPQRLEAPITLQPLERAFQQADVDHLVLLRAVDGGKGLVHATLDDLDGGPHFILGTAGDAGGAAPGQKLGVGLNIVDQGIHVGRRVEDQGAFFDSRHDSISIAA